MKWLAVPTAALILTGAIGCGSGESGGPAGTPAEIQRSIADGCKSRVIRAAFPDDLRHRDYQALAEETMVIGCQRKRNNQSTYARFESKERLTAALASIVLPPGSVESYCVTEHEAFTVDFSGSFLVCKEVRGRFHNVRRPPLPSAVTGMTYAPNCGTASYLEYKPPSWSAGCTAGSVNIRRVTWRIWSERVAIGSGMAGLRGGCHPNCSEKDAYYKAEARVRLYRARTCADQDVTLRYFTRTRWRAYLRPGNPFDRPAGWWKVFYKTGAFKGECMLTREGALYGN